MEYLQKLSEQGKSPLQVINLIFNRILFEDYNESIEKVNYSKLNPDFINEVKLYQKLMILELIINIYLIKSMNFY